MKRFFALGILGVLLGACGLSDHAGTSTETTNGVAGVVRLDGKPLVAAKVTLVNTDGKRTAFVDSSDSSGRFVIRADSGRYHLLVESADSSSLAWLYNVITGKDTALAVGASAPGAWLLDGLSPLDSVCILSSPYCVRADGNGQAFFDRLPAASFTATRQSYPLASATVLSNDTVKTSFTGNRGFVLEDFDDGDSRHLLEPLSGGKGWYLSLRSHTRLQFPADSIPFSLALVTEGAWKGRSLKLQFEDSAAADQVVSVQVGLFLSDSSLDLSSLDSLCFWSKGDGMLRVALEQMTLGRYRKTIWDVSLFPGEWRETSLVMSDADTAGADNVPFVEIGPKVHLLTFFLSKSRSFRLDQIRLVGVRPDHFSVLR